MKHLNHKFYDFERPKSESLNVDERFNEAILRFYRSYTKNLVLFNFSKEQRTVDWHCFECKAQIQVDISPILNGSKWTGYELFCKEHKPQGSKGSKIYDSYLFIRYEDSFYYEIRQTLLSDISDSTKTK